MNVWDKIGRIIEKKEKKKEAKKEKPKNVWEKITFVLNDKASSEKETTKEEQKVAKPVRLKKEASKRKVIKPKLTLLKGNKEDYRPKYQDQIKMILERSESFATG